MGQTDGQVFFFLLIHYGSAPPKDTLGDTQKTVLEAASILRGEGMWLILDNNQENQKCDLHRIG